MQKKDRAYVPSAYQLFFKGVLRVDWVRFFCNQLISGHLRFRRCIRFVVELRAPVAYLLRTQSRLRRCRPSCVPTAYRTSEQSEELAAQRLYPARADLHSFPRPLAGDCHGGGPSPLSAASNADRRAPAEHQRLGCGAGSSDEMLPDRRRHQGCRRPHLGKAFMNGVPLARRDKPSFKLSTRKGQSPRSPPRDTTNASIRRLSILRRTDFSDHILSRNKRNCFNAFCMAAGILFGSSHVRCTIGSFAQLHAGVAIGENHENADCDRDACFHNRFAGFGANPNAPCSDPAKSITVRPAHRPVRRSQRGSAAFWHPRQRSLRQQSLSRVRSRLNVRLDLRRDFEGRDF